MSLENILNPERSSVVKENREYLKMLIEFNLFFCLQELPYRGHDETYDSMNTGNWKEFIKMQLSTNSTFKHLIEKVKAQYSSYYYTSKTMCIEFIKALADETKWIVKVNLEIAGTYSILIDECKDNAGHEELALCFRYVNQDGYIEERFYEMIRLKDTDADSIFQIGVLNTLENIGLTSSLIALGADGASVMSGCNEGVYSKMKRTFPWLIYIHCTAHRLNLIVLTYLKVSVWQKDCLTCISHFTTCLMLPIIGKFSKKHKKRFILMNLLSLLKVLQTQGGLVDT